MPQKLEISTGLMNTVSLHICSYKQMVFYQVMSLSAPTYPLPNLIRIHNIELILLLFCFQTVLQNGAAIRSKWN